MPAVMLVALTAKLVERLVVSPQRRFAMLAGRHPAAHEALERVSFVRFALEPDSGYMKSLAGGWMSLTDAVIYPCAKAERAII